MAICARSLAFLHKHRDLFYIAPSIMRNRSQECLHACHAHQSRPPASQSIRTDRDNNEDEMAIH